MQDTIKNICNAIQMEAEAVKGYTDKIRISPIDSNNLGVMATFLKNQMDAVEHMQNLILELTTLMSDEKLLASSIGGEGNEQS